MELVKWEVGIEETRAKRLRAEKRERSAGCSAIEMWVLVAGLSTNPILNGVE